MRSAYVPVLQASPLSLWTSSTATWPAIGSPYGS